MDAEYMKNMDDELAEEDESEPEEQDASQSVKEKEKLFRQQAQQMLEQRGVPLPSSSASPPRQAWGGAQHRPRIQQQYAGQQRGQQGGTPGGQGIGLPPAPGQAATTGAVPQDFNTMWGSPTWRTKYLEWTKVAHFDGEARFLTAVEKYRAAPAWNLVNLIVDAYIDGPNSIDVGDHNAQEPRRQRASAARSAPPPQNLFEGAYGDIESSLINSYGRFVADVGNKQ